VKKISRKQPNMAYISWKNALYATTAQVPEYSRFEEGARAKMAKSRKPTPEPLLGTLKNLMRPLTA